MSPTSKRVLLVAVSVIVSAISLVLVLQSVPLEEVLHSIAQADPFYTLVAFVFVFFSLLVRAIRWRGLLDNRVTITQSFHIINITYLGNQLPLRVGEVARSLLATRADVPVITSATSIVVERLADMLVVVLLVAYGVSQLPDIPEQVSQTAILLGIVALVGFIGLIIMAQMPQIAHRILGKILDWIPVLKKFPFVTILDHVLDGLKPLTQIRTLIFVIVWTVISWVASLLTFYFLHLAMGIETNYLLSVVLGIALASLSIALPVSVAALGPFEAAILLTGQLVGMSNIEAVSLGFLLHGIYVISYTGWGIIGLLAMGISPRSMLMSKPASPDETDEPSVTL